MEMPEVAQQEEPYYSIDLNWFEENNRSFTTIVWHCLCPACQQRVEPELATLEPASLVTTIGGCCAKVSGFVTPKLPLRERIFRLFIANGNKPLTIEELAVQLNTGSEGSLSVSPETLSRLLTNDRYYGFCQQARRQEPRNQKG